MKMTFELPHGIKHGDTLHTHVTLRELCAGDLIDAAQAAEQVRQVIDNGRTRFVAVRSEELFSIELLRRQVKSVGEINGPLSMKDIKRLHVDDLLMLSSQAGNLDETALEDVAARGRLDGASPTA